MRVLLLDTCGATGSIAVADSAREPTIIAFASLPGRTASERLVPTIKQLAADSKTSLGPGIDPRSQAAMQPLEAVVVVHGPGSFTGVRVGLSAAKGLCEALALPMIAISRLAVLASRARYADRADRTLSPPVRALLDAGRGEFYSGVYLDGVCLREALLTREELLAEASPSAAPAPLAPEANAGHGPQSAHRSHASKPPQIVVVCEPALAAAVAMLTPQFVTEPTAADALPLALERIRRRVFDDAALIDANYLRRTDAEIFAKPTPRAVAAPACLGSRGAGSQTGTPAR